MTQKKNSGYSKVLKYFWFITKKHQIWFWLAIISSIITSLTFVITPIYWSELVDIVSNAETPTEDILAQIWSVLIVLIIVWTTSMLAWRSFSIWMVRIEVKSITDIYNQFFDYTNKHSIRFFLDNMWGSLVRKIGKITRWYMRIMDILWFSIIRLLITIPFIIVVIFLENKTLWIIFFLYTVITVLFQYICNSKYLMKLEKAANEKDSKLTWWLWDTTTNNFNILSFGSIKLEKRIFAELVETRWKFQTKSWMVSDIFYFFNWLLIVLFRIFALYFCIILWSDWVIDTAIIVLVMLYIIQIWDQIFFISNVFKQFNIAIWESAEALEILDQKHEITDKKWAKPIIIKNGKIEIKDINFSYNKKEKNIFKKLNIKINPGEKIAFVWKSGAWKSSILKLIMRFYDLHSGSIKIDWQDISHVQQETLRQQISIVPQEPILFHRSIADNIKYGKQDASMEEIIAVSKLANCHSFISNMKDWYDTLVWERWVKLSWWERQRVAIARAMLENNSILLLDEATSSLDSHSEHEIQIALDNLMKNKTVIAIAHRLSTIKHMDKIFVMENWEILESGSHEALLRKQDWHYSKLWNIQTQSFI